MIKSNRRHTLFAHNKYRKKETDTMDLDDFFKKATILPSKQKPEQLEELDKQNGQQQQQQQQDTTEQQSNSESAQEKEVTTKETVVDESKILDGVIACIDVRTEDGDDVSHNFELAIRLMGGETRKIFSDNVTHFVFKNGSNATLKKAMKKGIFIINLLWISRCRVEGKRLDEKDFLYEEPLGLVLAERKKRTKSMKPSKVKGLADSMDEDEQEMNQITSIEEQPSPMPETRHTFDFAELKSRFEQEERAHKRQRIQEELQSLEENVEEEKKEEPKSVLSAESIADRHNKIAEKEQQHALKKNLIIPCADETVKNNIKASFSIGQQKNTHPAALADLPKSLAMPRAPLKRKRKVTSNIAPPVTNIPLQHVSMETSDSQEDEKTNLGKTPTASTRLTMLTGELTLSPPETAPSSPVSSQSSSNRMSIDAKPTIVFTSLSPKARERCTNIVDRLGKYEVVSEVDERTTHVVAGKKRRTESVVLGLLRGAWILKPEWLFDVEDEEGYTPEHYYELADWITTLAHRKSTPLLDPSTHIWVKSSLSGIELIRTFIELAGGTVATSQREANIIISEEPLRNCRKPVVYELWIYECIDAWKSLPVNEYLVKQL